jgi:hypothetical protein
MPAAASLLVTCTRRAGRARAAASALDQPRVEAIVGGADELDDRTGLCEIVKRQRPGARQCGFERVVQAVVDALRLRRAARAEANGGREQAAQSEMKKRCERFVARNAKCSRDEPEHGREVTIETRPHESCAGYDEGLVSEAASSDVEECPALRAARAVRDMTPQGRARERIELVEAFGSVVRRDHDRQRAVGQLIDRVAGVALDAVELSGLDMRLETGRVREPAGRKCRVGKL